MISDLRTTFAASTALNTGAAGAYLVGNVVDLTTTGRDIGAGEGVGDLFFYATLQSLVTSGSATLSLATSDDPTFATGVTLVSTSAPVTTTSPLGAIFASRLPAFAYKRYLGLVQTTTTAVVGGTVTANLTEDVNAIRYYPQAFS